MLREPEANGAREALGRCCRIRLRLYRGDSYRWRFMLWADPDRSVAVDLTGVVVGAEIRSAPAPRPFTRSRSR